MDWGEFFDLIETKAIDTYKGEATVLVDKQSRLVVIGQGERILVLSTEQAMDLIQTLIYKLRE